MASAEAAPVSASRLLPPETALRDAGGGGRASFYSLGHCTTVEDAIAYWEKVLPLDARRLDVLGAHLTAAAARVKQWKKDGVQEWERPAEHRGVVFRCPKYVDDSKMQTIEADVRARRRKWMAEFRALEHHFGLPPLGDEALNIKFEDHVRDETTVKRRLSYRAIAEEIAETKARLRRGKAELAALRKVFALA